MVLDFWPIPIFPEGALASSVITCVWVGIAVTAFFNLRFGWTLSGVVVPGYLVPLLISKPWAAAAIYIEALVAYMLVRLISERLSRAGLWSSFFGRDRFFALILASVAARMTFDLWLLPELVLRGLPNIQSWNEYPGVHTSPATSYKLGTPPHCLPLLD